MQMAQVGLKKTNGQIGLALIAVGSSVNSISHGVAISRNAITVPNADALLIMHFGRWAVVNDTQWVRSNLPQAAQSKLF